MAYSDFRNILMASSAAAVVFVAAPAWAQQVKTFDIAAQPAASGITAFSRQADVQILVSAELVEGRRTSRVVGEMTVDAALRQLLTGTGLSITSNDGRTYTLGLNRQQRSEVYDEPTAVADIIVTAQKREESIQDVPIAVSAFSAQTLDAMKIEGGSELLRAIPNVSFSKNNFSMYNFSVRGIGTKAVSSSSDPAVAVSFNNSPMLRNRLFEAEYMDVSSVEVLRGPQGTLFGRNATAGVVNLRPNLPTQDFDAMIKGELGNYGSVRSQMMVNIPLSDDFSVRAAANITKRDGFDYNTFTETHVNGRDLYSFRLSGAWRPTDTFNVNLIWERFSEDDDRARAGKSLCTRDPGPAVVGATEITSLADRGRMSQGCLARSLYEDAAYGTPNGRGLSQMAILQGVGAGRYPAELGGSFIYVVGDVDPYGDRMQSRNLREIETSKNPRFRAQNDIFQLNIEKEFDSGIQFFSQTLYTEDFYWQSQDYNRYRAVPMFADTSSAVDLYGNPTPSFLNGGFYNDPQLGVSDRMESVDLSRSSNRQFTQEFRLQSNDDGAFNYVLGVNYLNFKTHDDYFVFNNVFNILAEYFYGRETTLDGSVSTRKCVNGNQLECVYVDYSGIDDLVGDGHNYFRSKNVAKTESLAAYGEAYYNITETLKFTLGLRYTSDDKVFTPYPSQLLLGSLDDLGYGSSTGGNVVRGYPAMDDIEQDWQALTGRAVLDWKFGDGNLLYASYSRGYKGGGANPPRADLNPTVVQYQSLDATYDPEYVDAFEVGLKFQNSAKNLRLNATAFYYDYKDYQISQIVDRISLNENFDSKAYGLEIEAIWYPVERLRIDGNLGLLRTSIGDGEGSIDVMNRTQGNPDWMVLRPWVQVPSNCIAPTKHVETIMSNFLSTFFAPQALASLCGGSLRNGSFDPNMESTWPFWDFFKINYNPFLEAPNGGRGFEADLSGNEFPNAPKVTFNLGVQYDMNWGSWNVTPRVDYYIQGSSYFRVYNTEYDRIKSWDNVNLTFTFENLANNVSVQAYVKNVFDKSDIVDAFTNSDDSMLTTNVFVNDPRIIGFSLTKRF